MVCIDCGVDVKGRDVCANCGAAQPASLVASDAINPMFQPPAAPPPPRADDWICPRCGETIEGQFTECWKCAAGGVEAPKAPPGAPRLDPEPLESLIPAAFACACGSSVCAVERVAHRIEVICGGCGQVLAFKTQILRERIDGLSLSAAVALLRAIFS
jgi:hypothetical protein